MCGVADRVEFRTGDAFALPLRDDEWRTFDVVHTRFMLESLADPGGNDSIVGRKLVSLLHDSGARPIRSATFSFGVCAVEPGFAEGRVQGFVDGPS